MTVKDYITKHGRLAREHGPTTALDSATEELFAKVALRPALRWYQWQAKRDLPSQRTVLDELRERDEYTILIFDAGRYDYLGPLLEDAFMGSAEPTYSAARDTFEWISKVWQGDFDDVTYVSGMVPVSDEIPDFDVKDFRRYYDGINPGESIGEIVSLWKTHWDDDVATVTPESVTNAALDYADRDKLVVHYNQPHSPFIGTPELLGYTEGPSATPKRGRPFDEPIWQRVRAGDVSDEYLRMAYWGNAARAIEASKPLVRERETVVATSDHGEALGEWGMYTHDRAPHPKRRIVPWQNVKGLSERDHQRGSFETVDEKLEALGYI